MDGLLALCEEVITVLRERLRVLVGAGSKFDVLASLCIHIEQVKIVAGECIDDAFVNRARVEGFRVGGLRLLVLLLGAHQGRDVYRHAKQAGPARLVNGLLYGGL